MGGFLGLFGPRETRSPEPSTDAYPFRSVSEQRDAGGAEPEPLNESAFTMTASSGGVSVTPERALAISAFWSCCQVLAETIATLPRHVLRDGDRGDERATDHSLWPIFNQEPNEYQSGVTFWEQIILGLAMFRNSYAVIEWKNDRPVALHPMLPWNVKVCVRNNRKVYDYWTSKGIMTFADSDVCHWMGMSLDGLTGLSTIAAQRGTLGRIAAMDDFQSKFFERGAAFSGVLTHPGKLAKPAKANLQDSWQNFHAGVQNAFKVLVLEEGGKLENLGTDPDKAQLTQSRKFGAEDVCRLFRMPPHKIQILDGAKYANIEQQNTDFATDCISPWCVRLYTEMERKMLFPGERGSVKLRFNIDGLLRGDLAARSAHYETAMKWGIYSINDVLRLENKPTIDGGDTHFVPLNMVPLDKALEGPVAAAKTKADPARMLPMIESIVEGLAVKEAKAWERARKENGSFRTWQVSFAAENRSIVIGKLTPIVASAIGSPRPEVVEQLVGDWVESLHRSTIGSGKSFMTVEEFVTARRQWAADTLVPTLRSLLDPSTPSSEPPT